MVRTDRKGHDPEETERSGIVSDRSKVVFMRSPAETDVSNSTYNDSFIAQERSREHQRRAINSNLERNRATGNIKVQRAYRKKRYGEVNNTVLVVSIVLCFSGTLLECQA